MILLEKQPELEIKILITLLLKLKILNLLENLNILLVLSSQTIPEILLPETEL